MDRFLSLTPKDRGQAFEQASIRRGASIVAVEKDFWVCLMLRELFGLPEIGEHLTFKGGTSLSKAWALIDRFSEDIDLTIGREALGFGEGQGPEVDMSNTERDRRLERIRKACSALVEERIQPALSERLQAILPTAEIWSLEQDPADTDSATLLFKYSSQAETGPHDYMKREVKLEFGARSDPWPAADRVVTPIVAEEFENLFGAPAVAVRALLPERTFWEKVLLLHEENFRPANKPRRQRMARHYYDVWRLIEAGVGDRARADPSLLAEVVAHRKLFFRYSRVKYETMRPGTIQALPLPEFLEEWRRDYAGMQPEMFVEEPPTFDEILHRIETFQAELNAS